MNEHLEQQQFLNVLDRDEAERHVEHEQEQGHADQSERRGQRSNRARVVFIGADVTACSLRACHPALIDISVTAALRGIPSLPVA